MSTCSLVVALRIPRKIDFSADLSMAKTHICKIMHGDSSFGATERRCLRSCSFQKVSMEKSRINEIMRGCSSFQLDGLQWS